MENSLEGRGRLPSRAGSLEVPTPGVFSAAASRSLSMGSFRRSPSDESEMLRQALGSQEHEVIILESVNRMMEKEIAELKKALEFKRFASVEISAPLERPTGSDVARFRRFDPTIQDHSASPSPSHSPRSTETPTAVKGSETEVIEAEPVILPKKAEPRIKPKLPPPNMRPQQRKATGFIASSHGLQEMQQEMTKKKLAVGKKLVKMSKAEILAKKAKAAVAVTATPPPIDLNDLLKSNSLTTIPEDIEVSYFGTDEKVRAKVFTGLVEQLQSKSTDSESLLARVEDLEKELSSTRLQVDSLREAEARNLVEQNKLGAELAEKDKSFRAMRQSLLNVKNFAIELKNETELEPRASLALTQLAENISSFLGPEATSASDAAQKQSVLESIEESDESVPSSAASLFRAKFEVKTPTSSRRPSQMQRHEFLADVGAMVEA